MHHLIGGFWLRDKAKTESVELVFTANGAQIAGAKGASQMAAGIKVMDIDTIDPRQASFLLLTRLTPKENALTLKIINSSKTMPCAQFFFMVKRRR